MTLLRRFFDPAPADAPAPPVNIAQLLASQGIRTDSDTPAQVPEVNIKEEEPKPDPAKATEQPKAETAPVTEEPKPEAPKATETPAATPAPAPPTATPPVSDWKEVLKNHPDPSEVLTALGFDGKIVEFFNRWKNGADVNEYLKAATTDYSKMTPEDLMKLQLQRDYPELDPADFEELYRMKVIEQYKIDPDMFNEQEVRRGKIMLQADARKLREQFTKEQQDYLLPKPPEADPREAQARAEAEQQLREAQAQFEQYKSFITTHNLTKDFLSTKMLTFGEGDEAFKYEVENPVGLLELIFDSSKVTEKLFDEVDGKRVPNVFKHLLMGAILDNDSDLIKNLANHYRKVGQKKLADTIENASEPGGTPARIAEPSDPVAQLAKAGIITGGG